MNKKHTVRQYPGKKGKKGMPSAPINYLPAGGGKKSKKMRSSNMGKVSKSSMTKNSVRQSHMRGTIGNNGRY